MTIALNQSSSATGTNKTAGTSLTVNTNGGGNVGECAVLVVALDNTLTTDGDNSLVTSVTDDSNNTWEKVAEFTNGQGGAASGATVSLWCCRDIATSITSGLITINHGSVTARAAFCRFFTKGGGNRLTWVASPVTLANDGADPGSQSLSSLTSREYLFYRATAYEAAAAGSTTATANFSVTPGTTGGTGTSGGGGASNMSVFTEYRITTATSQTSDPTVSSADCASIFAAFYEEAVATPISLPPIAPGMLVMAPLLVR